MTGSGVLVDVTHYMSENLTTPLKILLWFNVPIVYNDSSLSYINCSNVTRYETRFLLVGARKQVLCSGLIHKL